MARIVLDCATVSRFARSDDIRNGLQYQCISCALCIDACDAIMDNQKWPRGLIRYTSENALNGRKTWVVSLATIGYGVV